MEFLKSFIVSSAIFVSSLLGLHHTNVASISNPVDTSTLGSVTSVDGSGGTTGLTLTGGPITTSGTLTLGGTLGVVNGGTGTTTQFTQGSVLFSDGAGVYSQDNSNLFWDSINRRLGIGTSTPTSLLSIASTTLAPTSKYFEIGTSTSQLVFLGNGNLGLGVSNPASNIDIVGNAVINGANQLSFRRNGSSIFLGTSAVTSLLSVASTVPITFSIGSSMEAGRFAGSTGYFGVGTTTPTALLSVASSTATDGFALFHVATSSSIFDILANGKVGIGTTTPSNALTVTSGAIVASEYAWGTATSTTMTVDWQNRNTENIRIGTAGITITFTNATTTPGAVKKLIICNPPTGTAGTITWGNPIYWANKTVPVQTTTANNCDFYSFTSTIATSTAVIFGSQTPNF